jgi:hypothetical protein
MGNRSRNNGQPQILRLQEVPPELAAALSGGKDLKNHVPVDLQRIREINAFRTQLEGQEEEARELLALLPQDDPKKAELAAYHARLEKARKDLAPIHARALARVSGKVLEEMDKILERIRESANEGEGK